MEPAGMEEKSKQEAEAVDQGRRAFSIRIRLTIYLSVLFAIGVLIVFGAGLGWYLSPIFSSNSSLSITQRRDLVQGLASIAQALAVFLTGAAGLVGLYFTWKSLKQTRETTDAQLEQARQSQEDARTNTQRTLELTEKGQITERFTRAIDQLGATDDKARKKLEIRLGGIYALERIDKESFERTYHGAVMEILTAYIRENVAWSSKESSAPSSVSDKAQVDQGVEPTGPQEQPTPPSDIRAILDVIKRREEQSVPTKHRVRLDLRGTDLQGADLSGADLIGVEFHETNLQGANLVRTILRGARLQKAYLHNANLSGANLQGASLHEADLQGAILYGANLQGATLYRANLQGANLQQATGLTQSRIEGAYGNHKTKLPKGFYIPKTWH